MTPRYPPGTIAYLPMKLSSRAARTILWLGTVTLAACGASSSSPPAIADWHTNGLEAKQVALQTHHLLLVAFMGSDWSEPCQTIRKEVLDTQAFKTFSDANLVLLMADFSRNTPVPPELAKQYTDMAKGAQIDRFPAFMLFDPSNGVAFGRITNYNGGPDGFIAQIQSGLQQYLQGLQKTVQAPTAAPAAPLPPDLSPPSTPAFSQPVAAPPAGVPGLPSLPSSLPSPDELMHRSPQTPPTSP